MPRISPQETSQGRTILRREPLHALQDRLSEALEADSGLEAAIDALMQPLSALDACWSEVEGTLGDDPWAAHRLRLHLVAAGHWEDLIPPLAKRMHGNGESTAAGPLPPPSPGLIDEGALVVLGIAAMRVTALPGVRADLLPVPFGLAVAATPAEMLASLGDNGLRSTGLATFLRSFSSPSTADMHELRAPLRVLWTDGDAELRWQRLLRLYERLEEEAVSYPARLKDNVIVIGQSRHAASLWDGAHAFGFTSVAPFDAGGGEQEVALLSGMPALGDGQRVVFGAAPRAVWAVEPTASHADGLLAPLPEAVEHGWVGIELDSMRDASNAYRVELQTLCQSIEEQQLAADVPAGLVAALPNPAMPPLQKHNRWRDPTGVAAGPRIARRAIVFRPTVLHEGEHSEAAPATSQLQDIAARHGVELKVIDGLPWVEDTLAVVNGRIEAEHDARVRTLLDALRRAAVRSVGGEDALWLVLLPPADDGPQVPGSPAMATHATPQDGWSRGMRASGCAAVAVSTQDDAALTEVFEHLRRGGWPERPRRARPYLRVLGTVRRDGSFLLEEVRAEKRRWRPASAETDQRKLHELDPLETARVNLALLDGKRGELLVQPAEVTDGRRPAVVTALLPLSPAVRAVSVLRPRASDIEKMLAPAKRELARRVRPAGTITLEDVAFETATGKLSFRYEHSAANAARLSLELERGGIWTHAGDLHGCGGTPDAIDIGAFGPFTGMRLVASDGWNAEVAEARADDDDVSHARPALPTIRALDDGRFWVAAEGARWRHLGSDGVTGGAGAFFTPPTTTAGELVLELPDQPRFRPRRVLTR